MAQKLTEVGGELEQSTNTVKGFNISLSVIDRIIRQKVNINIKKKVNNTIKCHCQ